MQAAQSQRIDVLVRGGIHHAGFQDTVHTLLVGVVVPLPVSVGMPFAGGIEKQRLAMRGRNDHCIAVGDLLVFRDLVECSGSLMHGRSKHIGLQTEDQFAHLVVCLGADVAALLLEIVLSPAEDTPVLIVDEDTTVFHGRGLRVEVRDIDCKGIPVLHRSIEPPPPRADTDLTADGHKSEGRSPAVAPGDHDGLPDTFAGIVYKTDSIPFPAALDGGNIYLLFLNQGIYPRRRTYRSSDDCIFGTGNGILAVKQGRLHVSHLLDIRPEEFCRCLYNCGILLVVANCHDRLAVNNREGSLAGTVLCQSHLGIRRTA